MPSARITVLRCVPVLAGLALVAPAAVAIPLSTAAEPLHTRPQHTFEPQQAIIKNGRLADHEFALLRNLQVALTRVADGSTYVWHSTDGRLSGTIRPTASFRDARGELCRHLVIGLSSEKSARTLEGIACRGAHGIWSLEG